MCSLHCRLVFRCCILGLCRFGYSGLFRRMFLFRLLFRLRMIVCWCRRSSFCSLLRMFVFPGILLLLCRLPGLCCLEDRKFLLFLCCCFRIARIGFVVLLFRCSSNRCLLSLFRRCRELQWGHCQRMLYFGSPDRLPECISLGSTGLRLCMLLCLPMSS